MSGSNTAKAPLSSGSGDANDPWPRRSSRRNEMADFATVLDRLRDGVLLRIERIETLASEQAALLETDSSERERSLRERVALLEASLSRAQAEAKRREQEWEVLLEHLDHDRGLLAEAWAEIERERIEQSNGPGPRAASPSTNPARAAVPDSHVKESSRSVAETESDDAVARSILWQFRTLKSDVRKHAKRRNPR